MGVRRADYAVDRSLDDELLADIAKFELDPYGYVMYAFPWGEKGTELEHVTGPRKWQKALLDKIGKKLRAMAGFGAGVKKRAAAMWGVIQEAIASGHGIGKSAFFGMFIMWALSTHEDTRIVITANTEKQLQTKTSPELAKWHRLAINSHWFVYTTTQLYSSDPAHAKTWRADLIPWSEHNTEAFQGLHNERKRIVLIYDEASAIADKVWDVSEGALTDKDTQIIWLAFGNGTRNTGRFRECFRKYKHRWGHEQIDSRTVEGINLEQINKWVEDYGEDSDFVKVRVRGMFPAQSAKQFISVDDVDKAFGRGIREEQVSFAPKILSVEPAWTGEDELVIGMRQGLFSQVLRVLPKNDNDLEVGAVVAALEDEHEVDAVFVDGGYGTGIISYGRTIGRSWIIVWFGGKSDDEGCLNLRAAMWKRMRDWLKEGGCIPKDHQLYSDLIAVETVPDHKSGKLCLEPKEAMKARGVPSPNRGDMLALTFAHPVQKKYRGPGGSRTPNKAISEWNPLESEAA